MQLSEAGALGIPKQRGQPEPHGPLSFVTVPNKRIMKFTKCPLKLPLKGLFYEVEFPKKASLETKKKPPHGF